MEIKLISKLIFHWAGALSSDYERRLMSRRSWVQHPALYTGWQFFTSFVIKFVMFVRKRPGNNKEEAGDGPFLVFAKLSFV